MITMDQIHRIRNLFFRQGKNLAEIATILGVDWRTVRKYVDKEDFNERNPVAQGNKGDKGNWSVGTLYFNQVNLIFISTHDIRDC